MKFVGHLDLLRYFQKAFRRAGFQMEYSKGFKPHQIVSFAAPLAIGYTSDSEYVDIGIEDDLTDQEAIDRLNAAMADGIQITGWRRLEESSKNAMSIVHAARYSISLRESYGLSNSTKGTNLEELINSFLDQDKIIIMKKTKNSEKETNIRDHIFEAKVTDENTIEFLLATGSVNNLKPELVMEAFSNFLDIEYKEFTYAIHRIDLYAKEEEGLVTLFETSL